MEFGTLTAYQSKLLVTIFLIETGAGLWLWTWLAAKGSASESSLSPKGRSRLYLYVFLLLLLLVLAVTLGGILSHFDRPWYAIRGVTNGGWVLSPAHYLIFLICYPAYIFLGGAIHILLKNWLPDLLLELKWPLVISVAVPFSFIPAIDGNLLDQNLTTAESFYITIYWVANLVWIIFGIVPVGFITLKRFMNELDL